MEKYLVRFGGVQATIYSEKKPGPQFVVLLGGFPPGTPVTQHHPAVEEAISRGWSVLAHEYPGVGDSTGTFTPKSALQSARRAVTFLKGGKARDQWSKETITWRCREIAFVGSSFGGSVALVAAGQTEVRQALAISPVVDWGDSLGESDTQIRGVLKRVHRNTVRLGHDWNEWEEVQPADWPDQLRSTQVFLVAAQDDEVVPAKQSVEFARKIRGKLTLLKEGGHIGLSDVPGRVWTRFLGPKKR